MDDVWSGLVRLDPIDTKIGHIEVAYERGVCVGVRPPRFLPTWAHYLLPLPAGAEALVVVNRNLALTIFHATQLRCCFSHDNPCTKLSPHDLAYALHDDLAAGREIDDLFQRYRALVAGQDILS